MEMFSEDNKKQWENPWHWFWLASCLINSIYSYTWDIKMDWGLLDKNAKENKLLRDEVVYSSAVSFVPFSRDEKLKVSAKIDKKRV